jgi:hypothetical protein
MLGIAAARTGNATALRRLRTGRAAAAPIDSDSADKSLDHPRQAGSEPEWTGPPATPTPPVFRPNLPPPGNTATDCCTHALNAGLDRGDWGGIADGGNLTCL